MNKRPLVLTFICILTAPLLHTSALAQFTDRWGFLMTDINVEPNAVFCEDGAGGVIVAWTRTEFGETNSDIYAQRFDDHGYEVWPSGGAPICVDASDQTDPRIVADGSGGAIITWQDTRAGGYGVYGQRVSSNGVWQWASNGIPIAWEAATQASHETIADGFGGAIVVWEQFQLPYYQIRGQRVSPGGSLLWGASVTVGVVAAHMRYPALCLLPDATESGTRVSIAWRDYRNSGSNGSDIYMQRVTLGGMVQWVVSGKAVYAGASDQLYPDLVPSNSSSTIIAWRDLRNGDDRGYMQKLDRYGNAQWSPGGVEITGMEAADEGGPRIVSDGDFGVFATAGWNSHRYDSDGTFLWRRGVSTGIPQFAFNMRPILLDDGNFGLVNHRHPGGSAPHEVLGRKLDRDTGGLDLDRWDIYGEPLSNDAQFGQPFELLTSGSSLYALWDWSQFDWFFTLQRLDVEEAYWGYPRPVVVSVDDVPDDEGGWLRLRVRASTNDYEWVVDEMATGYNVWRQIVPGAAGSVHATGDVLGAIALGRETAGMRAGESVAAALGLPAGDWESVGYHAAMQEPYYDFLAPTRTDAVDGSTPYESFVVTVHTTSPVVHFTSALGTGYSIDNLPPGQLLGLDGSANYDPVALDLFWSPVSAPDLSHYAVHRGDDDGFVPTEANRVATPSNTTWTDDSWTTANAYHYKVAAVDRHGNVGPFAALAPGTVTGVPSGAVSQRVWLAQNQPNPFNPTTTIHYSTAAPGHVELKIYDVAGREMRTLVSEHQGADSHVTVWDGCDETGNTVASGVYVYRLVSGTEVRARRMILLK